MFTVANARRELRGRLKKPPGGTRGGEGGGPPNKIWFAPKISSKRPLRPQAARRCSRVSVHHRKKKFLKNFVFQKFSPKGPLRPQADLGCSRRGREVGSPTRKKMCQKFCSVKHFLRRGYCGSRPPGGAQGGEGLNASPPLNFFFPKFHFGLKILPKGATEAAREWSRGGGFYGVQRWLV